jgi:hypothetical protein
MTGQPSQPSSGHSKLPWHVKNEEAIKVADSKGDSILSMYHTHLKGRRPINEVEANAALIVEAVNSHAALKARVAELEEALRALRLQALQSSVNDPANEWGLEALHQANAALSHAGPVARDGEK